MVERRAMATCTFPKAVEICVSSLAVPLVLSDHMCMNGSVVSQMHTSTEEEATLVVAGHQLF